MWEAYKKVKANRGAAGVDRQTIEEFDSRLADNLYKLWNRLASGSYQPPPVRRVEIPKAGGGVRPLGIPTVADRVAQMVVKQRLEPQLEPRFHPDSYGYRPGRSAHQAVAMARVRCWQYAWVLDLDIKGFFDSIDHALLMKAIRHHTKCRVTLLYIERGFGLRSVWQTARRSSRTLAHRKAESSVRCWPICFCTMCSTNGCAATTRACRSNVMPMM
ncbi:reverse transcriptase domain-containing protein [Paraburkholderia sp. BL6669N2]|uniref:reverse transcriptase domain-containing protein n=1 Tax=Paraburkholderia sp. BL6669N2 TaxID=1938807 RepID=UPI002868451F|nr:reverse transcriptase domain-containing protein [Paraburkholderia sp. BL6669N2]